MSLILGSILNTGYICRFLLSRTPNFRHIGPQQLSPPQQKHVQIQIHPLPDLSNDFPCFSRGFPHKFFPPGFRVSAPQRRQVGREDLARPRGSAADIPAEVRAAGRFAEHQEGDQGPGRWGQRGWIFSGEYIMIYIW